MASSAFVDHWQRYYSGSKPYFANTSSNTTQWNRPVIAQFCADDGKAEGGGGGIARLVVDGSHVFSFHSADVAVRQWSTSGVCVRSIAVVPTDDASIHEPTPLDCCVLSKPNQHDSNQVDQYLCAMFQHSASTLQETHVVVVDLPQDTLAATGSKLSTTLVPGKYFTLCAALNNELYLSGFKVRR
jgi:hypothetical protein